MNSGEVQTLPVSDAHSPAGTTVLDLMWGLAPTQRAGCRTRHKMHTAGIAVCLEQTPTQSLWVLWTRTRFITHGLYYRLHRHCPRGLAGNCPLNAQSNWLWHLCSYIFRVSVRVCAACLDSLCYHNKVDRRLRKQKDQQLKIWANIHTRMLPSFPVCFSLLFTDNLESNRANTTRLV